MEAVDKTSTVSFGNGQNSNSLQRIKDKDMNYIRKGEGYRFGILDVTIDPK